MNKKLIDVSTLKNSLIPHLNKENEKRVFKHLQFFSRILRESPQSEELCEALLTDGVSALFKGDYWLTLEVYANVLSEQNDWVFRRCLYHFAKAYSPDINRPSKVVVSNTSIDILSWYRRSWQLGEDIHHAISAWEKLESVAPSSRIFNAQSALKCLIKVESACQDASYDLSEKGLRWFDCLNRYNEWFISNPIDDKYRVLQSSLLSVLRAFDPQKFTPELVKINAKTVDVTDMAEACPEIVEQLMKVAGSPKYQGKKDHDKKNITQRYISCVSTIRTIFKSFPESSSEGLSAFKSNGYSLLGKAKCILDKKKFTELVLFLEVFYGHPIHRHFFNSHLLPFHIKKFDKFRNIDISEFNANFSLIYRDIKAIHKSETELIEQKNYGMISLHSRFAQLVMVLNQYLLPSYPEEAKKHGLRCLSYNKNVIQKSIFQKIQESVNDNKIALTSGAALRDAVRWLMELTNQPVVEAFHLSHKRYQTHARRLRTSDLYADDELRELVFYIEKGIKVAKDQKQLLALYFARIQLKTCWNTSAMADIEVSDIKEISLPTVKKALTVLIQKPRKGYASDCYSMDGKSVNSVMRDISHVKDVVTENLRKGKHKTVHGYLFIYREKGELFRLDHNTVIAHISSILSRLGCSVSYNSQRIRKSGLNHLYREVSKKMQGYEALKLNTFDTFINNYLRIEESNTQETLHDAVAVMEKYFTGREIDKEIKILTDDDESFQKTPTGECASKGNDAEAIQYHKEHRKLKSHENLTDLWCGDYLACIWCKHFRTVADAEHVWQLLSYREFVLADMSSSVAQIENNEFQQSAIKALHSRVDFILSQVGQKNHSALLKGKELLTEKGIHPFWSFAVSTSKPPIGGDL